MTLDWKGVPVTNTLTYWSNGTARFSIFHWL